MLLFVDVDLCASVMDVKLNSYFPYQVHIIIDALEADNTN